jgi:hypothetical protein
VRWQVRITRVMSYWINEVIRLFEPRAATTGALVNCWMKVVARLLKGRIVEQTFAKHGIILSKSLSS